uniref:Uncharacterized protein n=1 Tax=Trichuris muris TaxID=70415 RepID=A0A5S6QCV5_TRIMR
MKKGAKANCVSQSAPVKRRYRAPVIEGKSSRAPVDAHQSIAEASGRPPRSPPPFLSISLRDPITGKSTSIDSTLVESVKAVPTQGLHPYPPPRNSCHTRGVTSGSAHRVLKFERPSQLTSRRFPVPIGAKCKATMPPSSRTLKTKKAPAKCHCAVLGSWPSLTTTVTRVLISPNEELQSRQPPVASPLDRQPLEEVGRQKSQLKCGLKSRSRGFLPTGRTKCPTARDQ